MQIASIALLMPILAAASAQTGSPDNEPACLKPPKLEAQTPSAPGPQKLGDLPDGKGYYTVLHRQGDCIIPAVISDRRRSARGR
jgi:hypothetical protein